MTHFYKYLDSTIQEQTNAQRWIQNIENKHNSTFTYLLTYSMELSPS
jgi:hypothetical protein